ncbi:MAG: hypothetical protein ACPGQL_03555 [Thermoplasmatota archaeon]
MTTQGWSRLLALLLMAVALAGCSDDGGSGDSGSDDDAGTGNGDAMDGDDAMGGGMDGDDTAAPMEPEPLAPIFINGTVTGALDCTGFGTAPAQTGGDSQPVDAIAYNRSYSVSFAMEPAATPLTSVCVVWGDEAAIGGNTGTVPAGISTVQVYADLASGATYSIRIE